MRSKKLSKKLKSFNNNLSNRFTSHKIRNDRFIAIPFVVVFAALAASLLPNLFAATSTVSTEAESSTQNSNISKVNDAAASGGSALVFNSAPPPPTGGTGTYPIKASANGRTLLTADNKFYYYLADTAWHAPARMSQEDMIALLDNRRAKGFNTIQVSVLMFPHLGGPANVYGDKPFSGGDFNIGSGLEVGSRTSNKGSADYDYWDHVEYLIDQAGTRDMQINLVASWYGYAGRDWRGYINNTNATAYGRFLGTRFGNKKNIMWTHGGDNNPDTVNESIRNIKAGLNAGDIRQATRNMAIAIQQNESVRHLASYHANRRFSSNAFFDTDAWHTVAYAYSDTKAYPIVQDDYNNAKVRPVINPEAYYDQIITLEDSRRLNPPTTEQLRGQAYYTFLSGGVGFAYGNERIWDVDPDWRTRMNDPSATHITHVKNLLDNYKQELLPDHRSGNSKKLLTNGYGTYNTLTYAVSARTTDDRVGLAYFPNNRSITINMAVFNGGNVRLRWFNPNSGTYQLVGTYAGTGTRPLTYPSGFSDAVLVAEKQ